MRADEASLWQRFKEQGCQQARADLICRHTYLVEETRKRAVSAVPHRIDPEDLTGAGFVSLVQSVDRFDPARGVKFTSFAIARLRGAMLEVLRKDDWVPRSVRTKQKRGEAVEVIEVVSLEDPVSYGDERDLPFDLSVAGTLIDPAPGPEEIALQRIEAQEVRRAVALIPADYRQVIEPYYWGGLTLKRIAGRIGRSESGVHQRHAAGLNWLREEKTMVHIEETNVRMSWTAEEEERLIQALAQGQSRGQIATATGRSKPSIDCRVRVLREQGRLSAVSPWVAKETGTGEGVEAVRNGHGPAVTEAEAAVEVEPDDRDLEAIPTTGEDDAHRYLGEAMTGVLYAMQSTLDESVMQACGSLLYQIRRVQARLE